MIYTHDMMKPVQLKVEKTSSKLSGNEEINSSYSGGKVIIRGENEKALLFGKNQHEIALKSGYIKECLGKCTPKFPVRPLWVKENFDFCSQSYQEIIEYGYNTLITDIKNVNLLEVKEAGLKLAIPIKVYLDECCFFDESYQLEIKKKFSELKAVDYIYWEGTFQNNDVIHHAKSEDLLEEQIALFEVQLLESLLPEGATLIYYLPVTDEKCAYRQTEWLLDFCDDVGSRTVIAFSSLGGDPTQDHLPLHPFFDRLRQSLDDCCTPLLPLINVGSIYLGGGLWPHFPFDHISEVISLSGDHHFSGVISLINQLPGKGSLLDGCLWVTAQMLWKNTKSNQLAASWFLAKRPELEFQKNRHNLEKVRGICFDLSQLNSMRIGEISHDECREVAESIMARLRQLKSSFKSTDQNLNFTDYFTYFYRDAAKMLLHFLQQQNLPMSSLFRAEELQESFWTEVEEGSKSQVKLLEKPNKGIEGSKMNQIFKEVYHYDGGS